MGRWPFECLPWKDVYLCSLLINSFPTIELYELLLYFGYLGINPFSDICFANIFFHS